MRIVTVAPNVALLMLAGCGQMDGADAAKKQMAKGNCKYESFRAVSGKVDAVFPCQSAPGMILRFGAVGTYSDTGFDPAVVADIKMPGGKSMHIVQAINAERIGDCAE